MCLTSLYWNSWTFSSDFVSVLSTYNSSISNTSRLQEGITFEGCYGSGYCIAGDVYTETIGIGGVIVNNQTIGAARAVSSKFDQTNRFDGILGLGFDDSIEGKSQLLIIHQDSAHRTEYKSS